MNVEVTKYEKCYTFELEPITQLCGQNVRKKSYIIESLRRYFSTHKYSEGTNMWRDNVRIDNQLLGRKYFSIITIQNTADIIGRIKGAKQGLLLEYIRQLLQNIEWQKHLDIIENKLEEMFSLLNEEIHQIGGIELSYDTLNTWDMVQKSEVIGTDEKNLEEKSSFELLTILLKLIEQMQMTNPRKTLVIIENLDHIVSREHYNILIKKFKEIVANPYTYFLVTVSIDGYGICTEDICQGITVFGDRDFQMPALENVMNYINNNYPYYKSISRAELEIVLSKIIHKIGQKSYLCNGMENTICKLINQTLMLDDKLRYVENAAETAFLME